MRSHGILAVVAITLLALASPRVLAGGHTWDVNEVFSNPDGTIQFIELKETGGGAFETGTAGHAVTSNTSSFTLTANVAQPTSFKHILLGTAAFAALSGAPTPNYIIPANFLSVNGDMITYNPFDFLTYGSGILPTDGIQSLGKGLVVAANSPTNYAGVTGSINANPPAGPPGVPGGEGSSTPMTVVALDSAGSSLSISFDTTSCSGAANNHIIYGQGFQLPSAPGGAFGLTGSVCGIGATSPFIWNSVPDATDGSSLIWWLIAARNASGVEGSWGRDGAGGERNGPGVNGSSAQCGVTSKDVSNTCGH